MTVSAAARQALPEKLRIAVSTVRWMEAGLGRVHSESVRKVQRAPEEAGIQFVDENGGVVSVGLRKRDLGCGSRSSAIRCRRRRFVSTDWTSEAALVMVICETLSCVPELHIVGSRRQAWTAMVAP